jgi:hypothetical protein
MLLVFACYMFVFEVSLKHIVFLNFRKNLTTNYFKWLEKNGEPFILNVQGMGFEISSQ